jgi:small subunit ribosomal protein S7
MNKCLILRKKNNNGFDFLSNCFEVKTLTQYLTKRGKKSLAETIVQKLLFELKKKTNQNPIFLLEQAIKFVSPSFAIQTIRHRRKKYIIIRELSEEKQRKTAIKWLALSCNDRQEKTTVQKLVAEILDIHQKKGYCYQKLLQVYKEANQNRTNFFRKK